MTTIDKNDFVKAQVHVSVTPGEAIRMIRELQSLSQNDLSELTGISQSNLSALENDARQLGRITAITLAKALHVHPSVLLFPDYQVDIAA